MVAAILNVVHPRRRIGGDLVSERHDSSVLAEDADCSAWTPCRTNKPPPKWSGPKPRRADTRLISPAQSRGRDNRRDILCNLKTCKINGRFGESKMPHCESLGFLPSLLILLSLSGGLNLTSLPLFVTLKKKQQKKHFNYSQVKSG